MVMTNGCLDQSLSQNIAPERMVQRISTAEEGTCGDKALHTETFHFKYSQ